MKARSESEEDRHLRLLKVIGSAEFAEYPSVFKYVEMPLEDFPAHVNSWAVAVVRDTDRWSQLVPVEPGKTSDATPYKLFSFHFDHNGPENSGFVGWLASHLRRKVGTGVIVVCGHNKDRGGVFDYWGCPVPHADQALQEVRDLMGQGRNLL